MKYTGLGAYCYSVHVGYRSKRTLRECCGQLERHHAMKYTELDTYCYNVHVGYRSKRTVTLCSGQLERLTTCNEVYRAGYILL
jgi:hypothetical protein